MSARRGQFGRTRDVPVIAFRVTAEQYSGLAQAAANQGLTVNEYARARTLGTGVVLANGVTPAVQPTKGELTVVYDEGG